MLCPPHLLPLHKGGLWSDNVCLCVTDHNHARLHPNVPSDLVYLTFHFTGPNPQALATLSFRPHLQLPHLYIQTRTEHPAFNQTTPGHSPLLPRSSLLLASGYIILSLPEIQVPPNPERLWCILELSSFPSLTFH